MSTPTIYKPEAVAKIVREIARGLPDGRWVPCRPEGWGGLSLRLRLRCAWLAFTGRADLVQWEQQ